MKIEDIAAVIQLPTRARCRAEAMGFVFGRFEVSEGWNVDGAIVRGDFHCVCGQYEAFTYVIQFEEVMNHYIWPPLLDPALWLETRGSFSRGHLLADGYPPRRVDEILERGEAFDRAERGERNVPLYRGRDVGQPPGLAETGNAHRGGSR